MHHRAFHRLQELTGDLLQALGLGDNSHALAFALARQAHLDTALGGKMNDNATFLQQLLGELYPKKPSPTLESLLSGRLPALDERDSVWGRLMPLKPAQPGDVLYDRYAWAREMQKMPDLGIPEGELKAPRIGKTEPYKRPDPRTVTTAIKDIIIGDQHTTTLAAPTQTDNQPVTPQPGQLWRDPQAVTGHDLLRVTSVFTRAGEPCVAYQWIKGEVETSRTLADFTRAFEYAPYRVEPVDPDAPLAQETATFLNEVLASEQDKVTAAIGEALKTLDQPVSPWDAPFDPLAAIESMRESVYRAQPIMPAITIGRKEQDALLENPNTQAAVTESGITVIGPEVRWKPGLDGPLGVARVYDAPQDLLARTRQNRDEHMRAAAEWQQTVIKQSEDLLALQADHRELTAEVEKLRERNANQGETIESYQEQTETLNRTVRDYQGRNEELGREASALAAQVTALNSANARLHEQAEADGLRIRELTAELCRTPEPGETTIHLCSEGTIFSEPVRRNAYVVRQEDGKLHTLDGRLAVYAYEPHAYNRAMDIEGKTEPVTLLGPDTQAVPSTMRLRLSRTSPSGEHASAWAVRLPDGELLTEGESLRRVVRLFPTIKAAQEIVQARPGSALVHCGVEL